MHAHRRCSSHWSPSFEGYLVVDSPIPPTTPLSPLRPRPVRIGWKSLPPCRCPWYLPCPWTSKAVTTSSSGDESVSASATKTFVATETFVAKLTLNVGSFCGIHPWSYPSLLYARVLLNSTYLYLEVAPLRLADSPRLGRYLYYSGLNSDLFLSYFLPP